jgi:hypothetical protein
VTRRAEHFPVPGSLLPPCRSGRRWSLHPPRGSAPPTRSRTAARKRSRPIRIPSRRRFRPPLAAGAVAPLGDEPTAAEAGSPHQISSSSVISARRMFMVLAASVRFDLPEPTPEPFERIVRILTRILIEGRTDARCGVGRACLFFSLFYLPQRRPHGSIRAARVAGQRCLTRPGHRFLIAGQVLVRGQVSERVEGVAGRPVERECFRTASVSNTLTASAGTLRFRFGGPRPTSRRTQIT